MAEPFYITTAISYPNGRPHIGHAYEAIAADAMARFRRAEGRDVRFVTGTDEHGLKMVQTARAAGRDPLEFADEMSSYFREMCSELNISYDAFVRTSEPRHYEASIAIWKAMEANDKEQVRKITGEIIQLIDEGTENGQTAVDKIQQARDLQINEKYQEYLRLKEEALKKQLEAFGKYRQAAQALRDNFDPQNSDQREKVSSVFEERSESYREIMEKARDHSSQANELYKEVMRQQRAPQ